MYKESRSRTRQIAFFGLWLWLWETGSYVLIFQVRFLNSTLLYILKDFCPASDSVCFWIMWHCSLLQGKMGIAGIMMFKEKKLHWHLSVLLDSFLVLLGHTRCHSVKSDDKTLVNMEASLFIQLEYDRCHLSKTSIFFFFFFCNIQYLKYL